MHCLRFFSDPILHNTRRPEQKCCCMTSLLTLLCICMYVSLLHDRLYDSSLYPSLHEQTFLLFLRLSLLHVDWGSAQCFCVIRLLIPSRQKGSALPPSTPSLTLSLDSLSHQLPHAASSIHTIISCPHHLLLLLYGIWKSCLSLLKLLKSLNFKLCCLCIVFWKYCNILVIACYCFINVSAKKQM